MLQKGIAWRETTEPAPISFVDIAAWCSLSGMSLDAWHLTAISLLDETYIRIALNPPAPSVPATKGNLLEFFKLLGMKKPK